MIWRSPHGRPLPDWRSRTLIMGILNLTPDSFSDGGVALGVEPALARAAKLVAEGADILDLGAESTRPGATPVSPAEELQRLLPALKAIRAQFPNLPLSVDTRNLSVAEAAISAGADILNDVQGAGLSDSSRPSLAALAAATKAPWILMHNRKLPANESFWEGLIGDLQTAINHALNEGVDPSQLWLDPGFGFGKTVAQNLALVSRLNRITALGYPVLLGTSRKSTLGAVLNEPDALKREPGDAACATWGIAQGAAMIRVHDVAALRPVIKMADALRYGKNWEAS